MARVSQAHRDARRRQILDGAARCFTRNGFHATSMQDVFKEVDLSAGAVYRYFGSKEELIAAIAEETLELIRDAFDEACAQDPPPLPDRLLQQVIDSLLAAPALPRENDRAAFPGLMVQVWAETLRNEELSKLLGSGFRQISTSWLRVVETYRAAGLIGADVEAGPVARVLIAVAQGYLAQQALFGGTDSKVLVDGLRAVMSMTPREAHVPAREAG